MCMCITTLWSASDTDNGDPPDTPPDAGTGEYYPDDVLYAGWNPAVCDWSDLIQDHSAPDPVASEELSDPIPVRAA